MKQVLNLEEVCYQVTEHRYQITIFEFNSFDGSTMNAKLNTSLFLATNTFSIHLIRFMKRVLRHTVLNAQTGGTYNTKHERL